MRGQPGPDCFEALPQPGFEMTGHGDHNRGGLTVDEKLGERELMLRPEGALEDDDIVGPPLPAAGLSRRDTLDNGIESAGRGAHPLGEHQVVFDQDQAPGHLGENSRLIATDVLLGYRQRPLGVVIMPRGKVGSKAERLGPAKTLRSKVKEKEIRRDLERQDLNLP